MKPKKTKPAETAKTTKDPTTEKWRKLNGFLHGTAKLFKPLRWFKYPVLWMFSVLLVYALYENCITSINTQTAAALVTINSASDATQAILQSQLTEQLTLTVTAYGVALGGMSLFFMYALIVKPWRKLKENYNNWYKTKD